MKLTKERTNQGYEIVCYYPKHNGRYTEKTGNIRAVFQTDDVAEVAAYFAINAWSAPYGDSDYAEPTVYFNGERFPKLDSDVETAINALWNEFYEKYEK